MYRGRFAPSPTGPLHFGSLVTAVASHHAARRAGGIWLVRIEDVDVSRTFPGAAEDILATLKHFGFVSDEPVVYQTNRTAAYEAALDALERTKWAYACTCSRKDLGGPIYPGTCRDRVGRPTTGTYAMRVRFDDEGDFVIKRSDGPYAYQLAVVVDDAAQTITDIVRGADLMDSTPRQTHLQRLLGYPTPRYVHVPIATNALGGKLSKQTKAEPLDCTNKRELLEAAYRFLAIK